MMLNGTAINSSIARINLEKRRFSIAARDIYNRLSVSSQCSDTKWWIDSYWTLHLTDKRKPALESRVNTVSQFVSSLLTSMRVKNNGRIPTVTAPGNDSCPEICRETRVTRVDWGRVADVSSFTWKWHQPAKAFQVQWFSAFEKSKP